MAGRNENWHRKIVVKGQKVIEADPRIVDAFKNIGYSIEAAIADLVDNSIDAAADVVLIRFVRTNDELLRLLVIDNGRGMNQRQIDRAMQFAGERRYKKGDIGMYGMGLKSASLSQADSVTVLSQARGAAPVGRRWTDAQAKDGWKCDIVDARFVAEELDGAFGEALGLRVGGTVIRWDDVHDFQKASGRVDTYLHKLRVSLSKHLGLQLHRILASGAMRLLVDSQNVETGVNGIETSIAPLDPFSYERSGARGYPKEFTISIPGGGKVTATAHIWPARSKLPGYRLGGGAVARRQGFYFYRNQRLIQAGGWNNFRDDAEPHASLARVEIDIPPDLEDVFSIRFSKSGIDAPRAFVDALDNSSADDATSFSSYVEKAVDVYRTRTTSPPLKPVVPPGRGIQAAVRRSIVAELPTGARDQQLDIRWETLDPGTFFRVDRVARILSLNSRYRQAVLGPRRASGADAPMVKTLMYLLLNETFQSQRESANAAALLDAFNSILVSAAQAEEA